MLALTCGGKTTKINASLMWDHGDGSAVEVGNASQQYVLGNAETSDHDVGGNARFTAPDPPMNLGCPKNGQVIAVISSPSSPGSPQAMPSGSADLASASVQTPMSLPARGLMDSSERSGDYSRHAPSSEAPEPVGSCFATDGSSRTEGTVSFFQVLADLEDGIGAGAEESQQEFPVELSGMAEEGFSSSAGAGEGQELEPSSTSTQDGTSGDPTATSEDPMPESPDECVRTVLHGHHWAGTTNDPRPNGPRLERPSTHDKRRKRD